MKYALSLVAGLIVGAVLFLGFLYYNPFAGHTVSALAMSRQELIDLTYSAVPEEAIAFTNNGESRVARYPEKIADLWEPAIAHTTVLVTLLSQVNGTPAGIGIKFSSASERTQLLHSQALVDSAWHVFLPDSGTFFVSQTENLWSYLRNIVIPAAWNSADSWRGNWFGVMTVGPNALGTGRVAGGSGRFAKLDTEAVESWSAKAYSALRGPVAMTGSLTVAVSPYVPEPGT
jgi:hypothetical protein